MGKGRGYSLHVSVQLVQLRDVDHRVDVVQTDGVELLALVVAQAHAGLGHGRHGPLLVIPERCPLFLGDRSEIGSARPRATRPASTVSVRFALRFVDRKRSPRSLRTSAPRVVVAKGRVGHGQK